MTEVIATCMDCCNDSGKCTTAFRGSEGVCCGTQVLGAFSKPYCCPTGSECIESNGGYKCRLVKENVMPNITHPDESQSTSVISTTSIQPSLAEDTTMTPPVLSSSGLNRKWLHLLWAIPLSSFLLSILLWGLWKLFHLYYVSALYKNRNSSVSTSIPTTALASTSKPMSTKGSDEIISLTNPNFDVHLGIDPNLNLNPRSFRCSNFPNQGALHPGFSDYIPNYARSQPRYDRLERNSKGYDGYDRNTHYIEPMDQDEDSGLDDNPRSDDRHRDDLYQQYHNRFNDQNYRNSQNIQNILKSGYGNNSTLSAVDLE